MNHELLLFFCAMATGTGLLFIYDWIRILRRLIPHRAGVIAAGDFFFWIFCSVAIFLFLYHNNDGIIRSYAMAGMLIGMILYHFTISDCLVTVLVNVTNIPLNFIKKQLKRLLFVIRRCKIGMYAMFRCKFCRIIRKQAVKWRMRKQKFEEKYQKSEEE